MAGLEFGQLGAGGGYPDPLVTEVDDQGGLVLDDQDTA